MDFWVRAAQLILSLSILIFLHELGHFIPARIFKTRVEKFYLFFNYKFSLFKKKIGETEWGIGWIPLGGYVKIAGMIDESMDREQMAQPAQPWEFRAKPAWQRLIIMIGGVVVNIIVGFVIYMMVLGMWGEDKIPTSKLEHGLAIHPYMQKFGLKSGDNILAINGKPVEDPNDIIAGIMFRNEYNLTVQHADGKKENIELYGDVEYELFSKDVMQMVTLRHKSTGVASMSAVKPVKAADLGKKVKHDVKYGDQLALIDGRPVKDIPAGDTIFSGKKGFKAQLHRGDEVIEIAVPAEGAKNFLQTFPAFKSGMRPGDKILAINGSSIVYFDEIQQALFNNKKKKIDVNILRGKDTLLVHPYVSSTGTLGFAHDNREPEDFKHIEHKSYGFFASIGAGIHKGTTILGDYVGQLKFIFTKKGATSLGGFGTIGKLFPTTWNWEQFWLNTAFISIILAFMNILPIPALDGGHVVFLLYEIITRREAPQKVLEYAQMVGFFILIALILYANGNDIIAAFTGN